MNVLVGGAGGRYARDLREAAYWKARPQLLHAEKLKLKREADAESAAKRQVKKARRELETAASTEEDLPIVFVVRPRQQPALDNLAPAPAGDMTPGVAGSLPAPSQMLEQLAAPGTAAPAEE